MISGNQLSYSYIKIYSGLFINQCKNQIAVEVEASSFDDASNIMFGDGEYDPNDWKLVLIDRAPIAHV